MGNESHQKLKVTCHYVHESCKYKVAKLMRTRKRQIYCWYILCGTESNLVLIFHWLCQMKSTQKLPCFKLERETHRVEKEHKQLKGEGSRGISWELCMFWMLFYGMRYGFWGGTWPLWIPLSLLLFCCVWNQENSRKLAG